MPDRDSPQVKEILKAITEIPAGQLSERNLRIAAGLRLITDHHYPVGETAKIVGVEESSMWRAKRRLAVPSNDHGVKVAEQQLLEASFDIAQIAAERIKERLLDQDHPWKDSDLTKAYAVAVDAIALRRNWRQGLSTSASEQGFSALAQILKGSKITLQPAPDGDLAIDVTPPQQNE